MPIRIEWTQSSARSWTTCPIQRYRLYVHWKDSYIVQIQDNFLPSSWKTIPLRWIRITYIQKGILLQTKHSFIRKASLTVSCFNLRFAHKNSHTFQISQLSLRLPRLSFPCLVMFPLSLILTIFVSLHLSSTHIPSFLPYQNHVLSVMVHYINCLVRKGVSIKIIKIVS